jgi:hypothetical protein
VPLPLSLVSGLAVAFPATGVAVFASASEGLPRGVLGLDAEPPFVRGSLPFSTATACSTVFFVAAGSNSKGSFAAAGTEGFFTAETGGFFAVEAGGFFDAEAGGCFNAEAGDFTGGKRPLPDDMLLDATVSSSCSKMGTVAGMLGIV